jgi:serine/threonine-protein kinase
MKIRRPTPALVAVLLAIASPARAEGQLDQTAGAALFQEAKQLASAGDYAQACPKFAEAQRLFPTPGTLLNLGNCYEKLGKLASAWGAFKEAEVTARNQNDVEREREASRRAEALAAQRAKLAVNVPPAARLPGFELRRDGTLLGEAQWGSALPIDTGTHTFEAKAPGRKTWSTWVRVETNGSSATIEVPVLEPAPAPAEAEAAAPFWNAQRTAGVVVGGVGLVSIIVGAVTGGLALAKASSAKAHCQPLADATACDPAGLSLRSDGRTIANVANVALAVGGAAIIGAVVLVATAPSAGAKPAAARWIQFGPMLGVNGSGLSIQGAW